MKKIIFTIYIFCILISCTDRFEEINTNPNAPIEVQPELLLRQVIYDFGEEISYESFVAGSLLGQHMTMVDFNLFDRHDLNSPQLGGNPWPIIYTNLRDNQILLNSSRSNTVNAVYEAPALILKSYMAAILTDLYGDVPFFEAFSGKEGIVNPRYDNQEDIYTAEGGIVDNLDQAISILENENFTNELNGDILYNGDLDKWLKFAYSLKIKYLMRISDRVNVSSDLQDIVDQSNYIISSEENATFDFSNTQPNTFRMAILRAGDFNLFVMSATMQEQIERFNDPRVATYFREATNHPGEYLGLLNGPDASNTSISVSDFSLAGTIFRENTALLDANFMTNWETSFLLAEAAARGLIYMDAQSFYEFAVQEAFSYWLTEVPSDYLTAGPAAFDINNAEELILTQKWLANVNNAYESWVEYRRTGWPQLKDVSASLNEGLYPIRMPYPSEEEALNAQNYQSAISQNQNSVNVPVWWDRD